MVNEPRKGLTKGPRDEETKKDQTEKEGNKELNNPDVIKFSVEIEDNDATAILSF